MRYFIISCSVLLGLISLVRTGDSSRVVASLVIGAGSGVILFGLFVALISAGESINSHFNNRSVPPMTEGKEIEGLGGWLIFLVIGLVVATPVKVINYYVTVYLGVLSDDAWPLLTTPASDAYNSWWMPLIYGEILVKTIMLLVAFFVAYKLFAKKKNFPHWYAGSAVFSVVFIIIDACAFLLVLPADIVWGADTLKELAHSLYVVAVWVPYVFLSRRCKNTFIN